MNDKSKNIKIARAYFDKENRFVEWTFTDNALTDIAYFKIENGVTIPSNIPDEEKKGIISIDLENYENENKLEIKDSATGEILDCFDKIEELSFVDGIKLMIKSSDKKGWEKTIEPIEKFSAEECEKIKKSVFPVPIKGKNVPISMVYMEQVKQAVEDILSEQKDIISCSFYKSINPEEGFGIERFVLDRVYYLPVLLEDIQLAHISDTNYLIFSEKKDRSGNSIKLEHRFQATSEQEAIKLYKKISTKLTGVQQKIWLACWSLGNRLRKFTYTCQFTDLMHLTYPERNGYFSVSDKMEFYEHLKSLEQTRFVFSKPCKKESRKKELQISYTIPLLTIPVQLGEKFKYPQQITLSIRSFDPDPINEKIYNVGGEIKHKTLELHADVVQLATWLQTRKSQILKKSFIEVDLNYLFKLAGLEKTAIKNKGEAKRLLKNKLQKCIEKGILLSYPEKLEDPILLKVR